MSTPTSANATHSNPPTPVCLEKRGRIPTMRLTNDSHNTANYTAEEANDREAEVAQLLAEENQVPYQPHLPVSRKRLIQLLIRIDKRVKFLEEFIREAIP